MKTRPSHTVPTTHVDGATRPRRKLNSRGPVPLALEPRIMFDGALGDAIAGRAEAALPDGVAAVRSSVVGIDPRSAGAMVAPAESQRSEIVFVTDDIAGYDQLLEGIRPGVEVVVLDHTRDGMEQILLALHGRSGLDAIHLVTHGGAGQIDLGNSSMTDANLDRYSAQLAQIGRALGTDADFLIYGCDVTATPAGEQFVARMAELTGADVAASSDTTGAALFGGDWELESQTGSIEADSLHATGYAGTLAVNGINAIAVDNRINAGEAGSVVIGGTVNNSGSTVQITVTDGVRSVTGSAPTNSSAWSATLDLSSLADGTLTVYTKQANNGTASSSNFDTTATITKDTARPTASISGPGATIATNSATFTFAGSDTGTGVASYEYQLDSTSGTWTSTTSTSVTLNALSNGSHTLYMRTVDAAGNRTTEPASYTLNVTGANSAPVASAQTVGLNEDTPTMITLGGTDGEGDPLGYTVATLPSNGTLYQVNPDGTRGAPITSAGTLVSNAGHQVWFEPSANANGSGIGNFTFRANDGKLDSALATVTVNVVPVNDAPVASGAVTLAPIADTNTNPPGASVALLFGSRFTDVDSGDSLAGIAIVSYTRDSSVGEWQYNSGSGWVSITGSVSAGSAISFKASDQLRFVPASGFSGSVPSLGVKLIDSGATVTSNATVDATGGDSSHFSAGTVVLNTSVRTSYSLGSPDSKFVTLLSGTNYDPFDDTQSHAADTDLVGTASAPLLLAGYDSNTGDLYYRVRIGNPTLSKGVPSFTGVVLLGLDTNNDGKLDVFVGVDGRNNGLGVVTFAPGSDSNTSPSTTSISGQQSVTGTVNRNFTYTLTGSDIGGDGKADAYLTFTLPFNVLASRVNALTGQTLTPSSSMGFVLLTATQNNAINGDIGGIGGMTKAQKAMSWTDLGLLRTMNMTAPTLSGVSGNFEYVENGAPVTLAPAASFSDADSPNFRGGRLEVSISGFPDSGKDLLVLNGAGVSAANGIVSVGGTQVGTYAFDANVLTVSFTAANVSAAQVNAVVRAVAFANSSDAPAGANRTVQFKVTDAQNNASAAHLSTVTVLVKAINDAPVVTATPSAVNRSVISGTTYDVTQPGTTTANAVIIARGTNSTLAVSDIDAANGTVSVTLGVDKGVLELYNGATLQAGTVTVDGVSISGSSTGALVLTGTVEQINAILAGTNASAIKVLYQPGLNGTGPATLTLAVNDQGNIGAGGSRTASAVVGTVTIAEPAPTGTLTGAVVEDNAVSNGNLSASGTLSAPITSVSYLGNSAGGAQLGTLAFTDGTWTYTVANGLDAVQALGEGQSILESFQVNTAGGAVFVSVSIAGVNDAPTLTVTNGAAGFAENGAGIALFDGASATLGGIGGSAESGQTIGSIALSVSNVFDGDQLVIDGTAFYLDQPASNVLTASGYRINISLLDGVATVAIDTAQATPSAVEALVTGLVYQSASENPTNFGANSSRTFTITSLRDSGGTAQGGTDQSTLSLTRTVALTSNNDAPAVNVAPVTLNQNSTVVIDSTFLLSNDPDTAAAELVYTVTTGPGKGTIKLDGVVATTFTQQDVNAGKVTFTAGPYGSDQADVFVVSVSDGSNTVTNTSVDVSIITTNYAPASADNTVTTTEDVPRVFGTADFSFSDFNTGDAMSALEIVSLPTAGKLQLLVEGGWQDVAAHTLVTAAELAAGSLRFVPSPDAHGQPYATFIFNVRDQANAPSTEVAMAIVVTPTNDAPVAANTALTTAQGVAFSGALPAASDTDNDAVSYAKGSDPAHGTVSISPDGTYSYTPTAGYSGSDSFTYAVSDGNGGANTYTVDVTVTAGNRAPVASVGSVTTAEDTPLTGSLPVATDADGDPVTYAAGTAPAHGTVTVGADGSYIYTPAANYTGSDSFTYTVKDTHGGASTYTVSVTVSPVNDAPTASGTAVSTDEDTPLSGTLPIATDIDGGAITYAKATGPAHGAVTINGDGTYTYTPDENYVGDDMFTYSVTDTDGASNTYTVTVTVGAGNDSPTASNATVATGEDTALTGTLPVATDADGDTVTYAKASDPANGSVTIDEDGSYTYTPNANFNGQDSFTYSVTDPSGATNTYTITVNVGAANDSPTASNATVSTSEDTVLTGALPTATDIDGGAITYAKATGPAHGAVTINGDGTYMYTPDENYVGDDMFTYSVTDMDGASNTYTVTVTVGAGNDSPTASDATVATGEDTALTGTLPVATDADGDTVTYAKASDPANGAVTVNEDGSYTYTPSANFNGQDSFTYSVTDPSGATNTYTITVNVGAANDAPTASNATVSTSEDTVLTGALPAAADVDGDTVTYAKASDPAKGSVTIDEDGSYTYTPNANFNGQDSFTYSVTDPSGATNTYTITVNVVAANDAPTASDATVSTSEDTVLTGALPAATDIDGDAVTYAKATDPANGGVTVTADGTYTYSPNEDFAGQDSFTYTVRDSSGAANTYTVTVNVGPANDSPTAADAAVTTDEDTPLMSSLPSANDPEGDAVTYATAGEPAHGTVTVNANGTYTYMPDANFNGEDAFRYSVTDANGASNTYTVTVTVEAANDAPVAANSSASTDEDKPLAASLPAATDAEGDAITYAQASDPGNGTVTVNEDGSYTYTPAANFFGTDTFTYTVTDSHGASNIYTVTITVGANDDSPTAGDLSASTSEDTALAGTLPVATDAEGDDVTYALATGPVNGMATIAVDGTYTYTPIANFNGQDSFSYSVTDANGGKNTYTVTITVTPVNDAPRAGNTMLVTLEDAAATGTLPAASDVEGDAITYALSAGASHGTVTLKADGSYSYLPSQDYNGTDAFTYTVSDGKGGSNTYDVAITVSPVNDLPVPADAAFTVMEDKTYSGVLPVASDVESGSLTYLVQGQPANGSVAVNADGSYTYTPAADFSGTDSFTYVVSDGTGRSSAAIVAITVTPLNDAPVGAGASITVAEDAVVSGKLPAATDPEGDAVSYSVAGAPAHGSVQIGADGSYRYTPDANYQGPDTFSYSISDGKGGSATYTVAIEVVPANDAPVAASLAISTAEDTAANGILPAATDKDGDAVDYSLGAPASKGTVSIDADGSYRYQPDPDFAGEDSFSYVVSDGKGGSATYIVNVTVTAQNDAPTAANASGSVDEDAVLNGSLPSAYDADGDQLTYSLASGPSHGTVQVGADGSYVYQPVANYNGADSFSYTVRDGSGASNTYTVSLQVVPVEDVPVVPVVPVDETPVVVPVTPPAPLPAPPAEVAPAAPAPIDTPQQAAPVPVFPVEATPDAVVPGSVVGNDAIMISTGNPSTRSSDASFELQVQRGAALSDVYTRSEGFRTVVATAEEPALVLFQGVPDQYIESGARVLVTVPADAFAHTQPKAVVRLAATMQDGSPLPAWVNFNGQTGQFSGQVPDGVKGELRIKLTARDQSGREATALFRLNVGQAKGQGGKAGLTEMLRQSGTATPRQAQPAGVARPGK